MSEAGVYLTYEERSCQRQEFISHMRSVHVRGRIFGRRRFPDKGVQFVLDDYIRVIQQKPPAHYEQGTASNQFKSIWLSCQQLLIFSDGSSCTYSNLPRR